MFFSVFFTKEEENKHERQEVGDSERKNRKAKGRIKWDRSPRSAMTVRHREILSTATLDCSLTIIKRILRNPISLHQGEPYLEGVTVGVGHSE